MQSDELYIDNIDLDREELINKLTDELPVLRAKIGLSQDELSKIIGVSRQTYSAVETKKRKMSWSTFMTLVLFFEHNENTKEMLNSSGAYSDALEQLLSVNNRE